MIGRSGAGKDVSTLSTKEAVAKGAAPAAVEQKDRHKPQREAVAGELLTQAPRPSRSQHR